MDWPIQNHTEDENEFDSTWEFLDELFPEEVQEVDAIAMFVIRVGMEYDDIGASYVPASFAVGHHNPECSEQELKEADAELCCHAAAETIRHAAHTMGLEKAFQEIQKILQATSTSR